MAGIQRAWRIDDSCLVAERITSVPLGFNVRALLAQSAVVPKALYASTFTGVARRELATLQTAILKAIWGPGRALRCKEIVFTLLLQGHRADPGQYYDYGSIVGFHRAV